MTKKLTAVEAPNQQAYETLKKIRASKTVALKSTPMLKTEIVGLDGKVQPFNLRYYQVQGIFHLLTMKRMILGDACGLGKTIEAIGFLAYLWEKEPGSKAIIVAPKSALRQWASEIERFSNNVQTYVVDGTPSDREEIYKEFFSYPTGTEQTKVVLIINYHALVRDWNAGSHKPLLPNGQPDPKAPVSPGLLDKLTSTLNKPAVFFDECQAFKSTLTKTWQICSYLSAKADRCYGLTATLLKNRLMEGFSIYKAIHPSVFTTKTAFLNAYCVTKMQPVGGGRKIPIVVGYKNLELFRNRIDPYFLGRHKHEVSDELPKLITKEVTVEMSLSEDAKYKEALSGVITLGNGDVKDFEEHKAFVALTYCQQVVDSLTLLKFNPGDDLEIDLDSLFDDTKKAKPKDEKTLGAKEEALVNLLTEDFDDEKVIVYTRFSSLVPRLQEICTQQKIKSVCITGKVRDTKADPARKRAQDTFQDLESDTKVIFITDAGSEAINLQAASAIIFYDAPWSWGNYVQLLGRPIRIGSPHQNVVAVHIVAERPPRYKNRKTIDHYTLELLRSKKELIDSVLGESAVGALDFGGKADSFTLDLAKSLQESE